MSAAAAEPVETNDGDASAPARPGRKKLLMLIAAAVLVAGAAGGGGFMVWKKRQAAAAAAEAAAAGEGEEAEDVADAAPRKATSAKGPPAFLPLDAFVVNLADRDTERFAQIGITLELDDPKVADKLKAYMPAIRNGILMVLAHKTSGELLTRPGKEKLAAEVMHAAVRPLGIELEGDEEAKPGADKKTPLEESPVRHVHFSSFIIQ
jgi:flagellar protein FliL